MLRIRFVTEASDALVGIAAPLVRSQEKEFKSARPRASPTQCCGLPRSGNKAALRLRRSE